jgi:putative oxidoreductase
MADMNNADIGKLILRLTVGVLLALHGVHKVMHGVDGVRAMLLLHQLPAWFAWGVYIGEVVAPLMVIVGYYTRLGAVLIVINMLFAIGLAHTNEVFMLTRTGGWALELQAFYLLVALALVFLGPGKYKVRS